MAKTKATARAAKPNRGEKQQAKAAAELTGARALAMIKPRLQALPQKGLATTRADIGAAAIAAQAASKRTFEGELYARFEKQASIGEIDLGDLELLALTALAVQEARQNADKALAKGANPKVPLAIIKEAALVEGRMEAACEHTLANVDGAKAEVRRLAPGTSYRDLAGDLEGYAALYDEYPDDVKKDGMNFNSGDPKLARALARKIYDALGDDLTARDQATLDTLARAWTLLLAVYERVAIVGRFLQRASTESSFPSLFAVARPHSGRPKKQATRGTGG